MSTNKAHVSFDDSNPDHLYSNTLVQFELMPQAKMNISWFEIQPDLEPELNLTCHTVLDLSNTSLNFNKEGANIFDNGVSQND